MDVNGTILDLNPKNATILGYKREEVIGNNFSIFGFADPETMQTMMQDFKAGLEKGYEPLYEVELMRKDGTPVQLEISIMPLKKDGEVQGIVGIMRDTSERKRMERVLQASEAYYRLLAEKITDVIFSVDKNMIVTFISPSITPLLGYSVEEAATLPLEKALTPSSLALTQEIIGEGVNQETRERRRDIFEPLRMEL